MTTALDLITRSAKALQVIGGRETLGATDANDGLVAFNSMMDSWSNERLMTYEIQEQSFQLQVGVQTYSVGPGGTVNVTRPLSIEQAYIQDSGNNNYLMNLRTRDWWNQIGNRGPTITSQIPTDLFYDPQYPLGYFNVFPIPLLQYMLFFSSPLQQLTFASLTTVLSLPPGYERAIVSNLALELLLLGFTTTLDQKGLAILTQIASDSKANVKRTNLPEIIANYDDAIVSRSYATYNIFSDRNGSS